MLYIQMKEFMVKRSKFTVNHHTFSILHSAYLLEIIKCLICEKIKAIKSKKKNIFLYRMATEYEENIVLWNFGPDRIFKML